jgi:hypothetical protein
LYSDLTFGVIDSSLYSDLTFGVIDSSLYSDLTFGVINSLTHHGTPTWPPTINKLFKKYFKIEYHEVYKYFIGICFLLFVGRLNLLTKIGEEIWIVTIKNKSCFQLFLFEVDQRSIFGWIELLLWQKRNFGLLLWLRNFGLLCWKLLAQLLSAILFWIESSCFVDRNFGFTS